MISGSVYAKGDELYRDPGLIDDEKVMMEETLLTFDKVRELHGEPLVINSGRRSQAKQDALRAAGYKAALYSPHVVGAALDVAVPDGKTDEYLVALIWGAAQLLGYQQPRVGWKLYRGGAASGTFVHFDFAFLLKDLAIPAGAGAWKKIGATW